MPRIHPTAIIESNVQLGEGTSVWDNAHIRHDAVLGEQCLVGGKSTIAYDVKIGHERHMIVTIPGAVADLPCIGQTPKILTSFEQCDFVPLLRQTERESHPKNATAEDCEMFVHDESFQ